MNYLMWRLHRNQLLIAGGALIVLTVVLLILPKSDNHFIQAVVYVTVVVPLLLGMLWRAPLLAKEFEDGTNGLAWTQGVTRRRWLRSNLLWAILAAAVWGAAVTTVVTWWSLAEVSLGRSRLGPGPFDIQGGLTRSLPAGSRSVRHPRDRARGVFGVCRRARHLPWARYSGESFLP